MRTLQPDVKKIKYHTFLWFYFVQTSSGEKKRTTEKAKKKKLNYEIFTKNVYCIRK